MHPYKRASILTDLSNTCYFQTLVLNSRTAAQSIKLIVPRYRLGKAQFKSELTANKKLPRYTCCISATNQAGEGNYTCAWMQDRTRYVC